MHSRLISGGRGLMRALAVVLLGALVVSPAAAAEDISVTQSAAGYVAGAKLVVTCQIAFPAGRQIQSLLWTPSLPAGWSLDPLAGATTGHGGPTVDPDGTSVIFLSQELSDNHPLVFQYTVNVPSGVVGKWELSGELECQLDGMANPELVAPVDALLLTDADAEHTALGYQAGELMTVTCTFSHPVGVALYSMLWRPVLPSADWKLVSAAEVSAGVVPAVDPDGEAIVMLGNVNANPLSFTYTVLVPAEVTGVQELRGEIEYHLAGMANPASTWAEPDPLLLKPLHTLEIISPYGTPQPAVGLYTNFYGSVLTNLNTAEAVVGARTYACAGWLLDGHAPASGTGSTCEITLANNAVLSWVWIAPQIGNRTVVELETLAFQAEVDYTNTGFTPLNLSYSLDAASLAAGMQITSDGAFTWTPSEAQGDIIYNVVVTVTDNGAEPHWLTATETLTITVVETNQPPVLAALSDQLADEHSTLTFVASASDPDLPTQILTFTLDQASLDVGMVIDPLTGVFSWSPTAGQAAAGPYTVSVTVTDDGLNSAALSDTKSFSIGVVDSRATHESFGYLAGRTAEIHCTFEHPADKNLLSLLWRPLLPAGWGLISTSGQATPEIDHSDNTIIFLGYSTLNTPNPLTFSYIVSVPEGLTGDQDLRAEVEYMLAGMANPLTIPVNPDPLILAELHIYEIVSVVAGQSQPPVGVYTNLHGTNLSAVVNTPLTAGTRTFACIGWTLAETNLTPVSGTSTNVSWVLDNDAVLTWHWVAPLIEPATSVDVSMLEDGLWTAPAITASEPYRPELESDLAWSLLIAPTGGTANVSGTGTSPTILYTPAQDWFGSDSFVLQVADGLGGFDEVSVNVTVIPVNDPPVLAPIGAQQTDEYTPLTFTALATDVDIPEQTLSYSISGAPPNSTFDTETGVFSWVPEAGQAGTEGVVYTVTVTVTDDGTSPDNQSDSETFTISLVPVRATHSTIGYTPGELLAINCQFTYPADRALYSLLWIPELPAGWTLESASGGGSPEVDPDGEAIVLLGGLDANPLSFTYYVQVPSDATGTNIIGGLIEYHLDNMPNPAMVRAHPDPLLVPAKVCDLAPVITAQPNVMHGSADFNLRVRVVELRQVNTEGAITLRIPKDSRWMLREPYDSSLTELDGVPMENSKWVHSETETHHVFTTASSLIIIPRGEMSYFGIKARWESAETEGFYTITVQIDSGSGGESRIDNNADAEKIEFL
ncbi:MAG: Ig-like domain-containing protein [Kiritimatiellae bacterium]|nr:Ig-like domain-containing protein [Kiritimatiellia bacterium]